MASRLATLLLESAVAGTSVPRRLGRSKNDLAFPGIGDGVFRGGPNLLELNRGGVTGAVTIYGANASDPNGNPNQQNSGVPLAQEFKGDGVTTAFQTNIPYVAFSNYNWICESSKYVLTGTVTVTAASNVVTGSGTGFLAAVNVGDTILVNSEFQTVLFIVSDTVLWTENNFASAAAGVAIYTIGAPIPTAGYTMSSGTSSNALCTMAVAPIAGVRFRLFYQAVTTVLALAAANSRVLKAQIPSFEFMWTLLGATPSATSLWVRPLRSAA
jgi:hypothetical protein